MLNDYNFWLGLLNLIVLSITLYFLKLYTKATEEMKEDMIRQGKLKNAHDILLEMSQYFYISNQETILNLKTKDSLNNIVYFTLLNKSFRPFGEQGEFYRLCGDDDPMLTTSYFLDEVARSQFLETLKTGDGLIRAKVVSSNGNCFLYTYKTLNENFAIATEENPNMSDTFLLVKKEILPDAP